MNLALILIQSLAWRAAYFLLAALFVSLLGVFNARAADIHPDSDEGAAYVHCMAVRAASLARWTTNPPQFVCKRIESSYACVRGEQGVTGICPGAIGATGGNESYTHTFPQSKTCQHRPNEMDWANDGPTDSGLRCHNGCMYQNSLNVGGENSGRNEAFPTGSTCLVGDVPAPQLDSDGDGVPDDVDAFPNDPNESADSDGDGIGDNADFSPEDPTDGKDTEGEEDGDDEGDNTASGGGDCTAPPSCSGDGIACNSNFQLWKLRCQGTAQGTVQGNVQDCSSVVTVTSPDAVANAQLLALRKIACTQGEGGSEDGPVGDANKNGVADVLEGMGDAGPDPGQDDDVTDFNIGINPSMLDQENIFGAGQCPVIPGFTVMGQSINPSDLPQWCMLLEIMRGVVLIMGTWLALNILMGRVV